MELANTSYVQIVGTNLNVNASSLAEAKIALKELKLKKKEFALEKRSINQRQKEIRASYTSEVRSRGSKVRGGGGVGKFFRAVQTVSRDNKRAQLASDLAPFEQEKQNIEAIIHTIDSAMLQVESYILNES